MRGLRAASAARFGTIGLADISCHLDGVLAVDAASFSNPWTRDMYEWEARHSDVARLYVYCDANDTVIAYCAAWHVFDELHINNLAVRPEWRRQGVARELLTSVVERSLASGAQRSTLEVRSSNEAARRLYESFGFRLSGVRKGYYTNPTEDALILWCELGASKA